MSNLPRPEYPRPQFKRDSWLNLNGVWTFTLDNERSGLERELMMTNSGFDHEILVPFCPESELSGVGHTNFIEALWYHRSINIPAAWQDKRILLNFGGVDYHCQIFVDGQLAGEHWGGSASFSIDISRLVTPGKTHNLVVYVQDDIRSNIQPAGKQSRKLNSHGCYYTRVTGIWQTVWLEAAAREGLERCHIIPDLDSARFIITPTFFTTAKRQSFKVLLKESGHVVASAEQAAANGVPIVLDIPKPKVWTPQQPFLYDLVFECRNAQGQLIEQITSYAGLRKIHQEGNRLFLNNEPLYLRSVLDQGYYPKGIWTAPSDEALKLDIKLSLQAGFNGGRLHQKVFEERFHYWADKLGYLSWAETASWGIDENNPEAARNFLSEWHETVMQSRNHPSIIAWTPFNETESRQVSDQHKRLIKDVYELSRSLDTTRPINDASGWVHVQTDLWTVHAYEQDPKQLSCLLTPDHEGVFRNFPDKEPPYQGQPYLVDEFGGIKWVPEEQRDKQSDAWGYGDEPLSLEDFYCRLEGLVDAILQQQHICGYCYTQLTDVEQEKNGLYAYDRSEKFDLNRIKAIFSRENLN